MVTTSDTTSGEQRMHLGIRRRPLSTRARAAAIALSCVIAGASGVAGAAVMISEGDQPQKSSQSPPTDGVAVLPAALEAARVDGAEVQANAHVRREAVGGPTSYPGSIAKAPEVAVAAYQRASAVMNAASSCQLDWLTLAAIGRVESNHSRGAQLEHRLTKVGVARPAIVGHVLNGRRGLGSFADTDAGTLDRNQRWDAPVGALALMPSTWSTVAVDADGDQRRNPQDIDDAALGAAVFLCADGRKLRQPAQLRRALATYHRAPRFVSTVLALQKRYEKQASKVPDYTPPGGVEIPDNMPAVCDCDTPAARTAEKSDDHKPGREQGSDNKDGDGTTRPAGPVKPSDPATDPGTPSDPPTSTDPEPPTECPSPTDPETPTDPPSDPPSTDCPTDPPTTDPPTESPTEPAPETTSTS
ncbi:hypothetical protein ASD66_03510 [Nocardioides sp. Root151]|nr:hypothetical protein ASD66_03510 [Nocardioides sp. Root151]